MNNLFICYTPLNVKVANEIISQYNIDNSLIVLVYSSSEVYLYSEVKESRHEVFSLDLRGNLGGLDFLKYFYSLGRGRRPNVYFGNIKRGLSRVILLLLRPNEIFSFDDGIGHLVSGGYFYNLKGNTKVKAFFENVLFGLSYKSLLGRINFHYSIYNVSGWAEHFGIDSGKVNLAGYRQKPQVSDTEMSNRCGVVKIFIGGVLSKDKNLTDEEEFLLEKKVLEVLDISLYVPHPRRDRNTLKEITCKICSKLQLAETTVIDYLEGGYEVELFGFSSSVLMNFYGVPGVKVVNLVSSMFHSEVANYYKEIGIATESI